MWGRSGNQTLHSPRFKQHHTTRNDCYSYDTSDLTEKTPLGVPRELLNQHRRLQLLLSTVIGTCGVWFDLTVALL